MDPRASGCDAPAEEKLRQLKLQQDLIMDTAPIGISHVKDRRVVWGNRGHDEVFGYSRGETQDMPTSRFYATPEAYERVGRECRERFAAGAVYQTELELRRKDGSTFWCKLTGRAVEPANPELGAIWMAQDVSERVSGHRALVESERNFRAFFEGIGDMAVVATPSGSILAGNRALHQKLGYSPEELARLHLLDLHPAEYRDEARNTFAAVLRGESCECPLPIRTRGGELLPVETRAWLGRWNGAECVFGVIKDLREAQEAAQRFERLFRHNPALMAISTVPERRLTDVNDTFLKALGYTRAEVIGKTTRELGLFPEPSRHEQAAVRLRSHGRIEGYDLPVRCKDGTLLYGLFSGEIIQSQGKQFFLTVMIDITERRHLEERLRQSQKMEGIGHLAGGMAHEFNNILAAILMNLSLVPKARMEPSAIELLGEVRALAKKAAEVIKQLLAFSRKSVLQVLPTDWAASVTAQSRMLRVLLGERISIEFTPETPVPWVAADRPMLEQVLLNLCINAAEAMNHTGLLRITLGAREIASEKAAQHGDYPGGTYVCLAVRDTGVGMDAATMQRLFEPFFTTKEVGQGTGLGLATVRGIVQQHRGWVEVESTPGLGSCFTVCLPAMTEVGGESVEGLIPRSTPSLPTILLVEDEPGLKAATGRFLVQSGFKVLEASNASEALSVWKQHHAAIDLLHTDMVMPGELSGLQLAGLLLEEKPRLKVILTSGYTTEKPPGGLQDNSAIVYLPKPSDPETLLSLIRKSLGDGADRKLPGSGSRQDG